MYSPLTDARGGAQLTYWSLQYYDHVPSVRSGRKALCKQMTALMLSQWQTHRHICENFSPHKTADDHAGDCSGTKYAHSAHAAGGSLMPHRAFIGCMLTVRSCPVCAGSITGVLSPG